MASLNNCLFNRATETAKQLLSKGVDINAKNESGVYPISAAISSESPAVVEFAIANGANVNVDLGSGWTPLHEAFDNAIDGMVQNSQERPSIEAVEIINILLQNGADIQKGNSEGRTPLDSLNTYCATREKFDVLLDRFRKELKLIDLQVEFKNNGS